MEFLYHYTNVDTLDLILKNKTFRFSSLENVDDLEEMETEDFGNLGRFCYVSCWTDKQSESIPMWKEYTSPEKGVRLKLPIDIFEKVNDIGFSKEQFLQMGVDLESIKKFEGFPYTKGVAEYERANEVMFMPRTVELFPVTYTKDKKLLHYSVYNENGNGAQLETKLIGKFKSIDWEYQSEWRYKLFSFPFGLFTVTQNPQIMADAQHVMNLLKTESIKYKYFDLPFKQELLNGMEILTSPIFDIDSKKLLDRLITDIPNVNLKKSTQRWGR
ncbi:DUF2971 domain-containing protein [Vagococcus fluvialis]|uniref:DUF2971 domain-containing protein n=1 Tax=Vagococcus fluvialis TaxID=2738 RepID=UPI001A8C0A2B|nr:DUF2971 domain-containing protein [Vagococcus fluvialis]MBO0479773.1 DUF2971 domain-containing protein [Vagococcus fluvialis]MBO0483327.1 DUF2971 domain-containing protein [Vagococcus fluvialis]